MLRSSIRQRRPQMCTSYITITQKPNRSSCIWGQCWVALGLSISLGRLIASIPLLLHLQRKTGNSNKIKNVSVLLRCVMPTLKVKQTKIIRLLVDAWYMKGKFLLPLLAQGIHARRDTALFLPPHNKENWTPQTTQILQKNQHRNRLLPGSVSQGQHIAVWIQLEKQ